MKNAIMVLILLSSVNAFAGKQPLTQNCLDKVVEAVNKHHTLAEGGVYALRVLYTGNSAASLLVGHSDETDPTDYLVTVKRTGCEVKSIVWTNEASDVEEYTDSEYVK
jgi:hypothetical protein